MTNKPLITRDDLYVTLGFNQDAEKRLASHFKRFIQAQHEERHEYPSARFVGSWTRKLVASTLSGLTDIAEYSLDCMGAGEGGDLELLDEHYVEAVTDTEEWYRWMLTNGKVKLPKAHQSTPAAPVTRLVPRRDAVRFL